MRVPYDSTETVAALPDHLERIARRDYSPVNEGYWVLLDAASALRVAQAIIPQSSRPTDAQRDGVKTDG